MRPVEHYERWKQNCGILRIVVPPSPEELCEITLELIRKNNFRTNVYVRPIAYKSAERVGITWDDQDAFALIVLPFGDYLAKEGGLHAGVSSWRRVDDNAIPARAKIGGVSRQALYEAFADGWEIPRRPKMCWKASRATP